MFLKKGEYQEGGLKREKGADTPFCTLRYDCGSHKN